MTNLDEINRRYYAMHKQARDKYLLEPPPYTTLSPGKYAFTDGYEAALMDIAKGEIDVPLNKG